MPSYLDTKPTKPKQKKARKRQESTKKEHTDSHSDTVDSMPLVRKIEGYRSELSARYDREIDDGLEDMAKVEAIVMLHAVLDSTLEDIAKIDALTDREDRYALNSLVGTKLKLHKALLETLALSK